MLFEPQNVEKRMMDFEVLPFDIRNSIFDIQ